MRFLICVGVWVGALGSFLAAAEYPSSPEDTPPSTLVAPPLSAVATSPGPVVTPQAPSQQGTASYVRLKRAEFELATALKVLSELADEHKRNADEATAAGQPERAAWEQEWAQSISERIADVSRQLGVLTKQALAFEAAHGSPGVGLGMFETGKGLGADEVAFVTLLQERLARVQEELDATLAAGTNLSAELATNNTSEAISRVSLMLQDNTEQIRRLQREQSDLELRKLEFRALRR